MYSIDIPVGTWDPLVPGTRSTRYVYQVPCTVFHMYHLIHTICVYNFTDLYIHIFYIPSYRLYIPVDLSGTLVISFLVL